MKNFVIILLFIFFTSMQAVFAQAISIPIVVSDNAASPNTRDLAVGVDPAATDGIDLDLGEGELPPMPPSGNFEARLFLPNFSGSLASYKDYRAGTQYQNGTVEYRLRYQKQNSATTITIAWAMPVNISGQLKDVATNGVIINILMSGTGSYVVTNPAAFNQLKMFITYNLGPTAALIKAVPEGFYQPELNRLALSDTFRVYLASVSTPYAFVDSAIIVIDSISFSGEANFYHAVAGNYYLVIRGRNSIETWSALGGLSLTKGQSFSYNFDSLQTMALGGNLKPVNGHWCIYSGDVNQDGFIDFSDLGMVDNDSYNYTSGYVVTDVNGDMFVDFSDLGLVDNNSYNYISAVTPSTKKK